MINIDILEKIRVIINNLETYIDGLFVTNESNLEYVFGQKVYDYAYITRNNIYILTNNLYFEQLKIYKEFEVFVLNINNSSDLEYMKNIFSGKTIGVEMSSITLKGLENIKTRFNINRIVNTDQIIEKVRAIKYDYEIDNIRKACEITVQTFKYILEYIKPYQTEKQIRNEMDHYMRQCGAQDVAFDTIVASGSNSSKPHAEPGNKKIQKHDIILLDFGCKYNGYCSDMSRTIFVGDITDKQKEMYELVRLAKEKALSKIQEYENVQDIDNRIRNEFRKKGCEQNYLHSAGHGVGIDVHEPPTISNRAEYILKENMVIAVEPGLYFENEFGIRIEDTVLVTKNGIENLTKTNEDIIVI